MIIIKYTTDLEMSELIQQKQLEGLIFIEQIITPDGNFIAFTETQPLQETQIVYTQIPKEEFDALKQTLDEINAKITN